MRPFVKLELNLVPVYQLILMGMKASKTNLEVSNLSTHEMHYFLEDLQFTVKRMHFCLVFGLKISNESQEKGFLYCNCVCSKMMVVLLVYQSGRITVVKLNFLFFFRVRRHEE